jgi:hypothetical protein
MGAQENGTKAHSITVLTLMLISYGDVSKIAGQPWFMLEIRSDEPEPTLKRLCKETPGIFREHSLEVFVPALPQDLESLALATPNFVFVRSDHFPSLLRGKQVTGIIGLATEGDCNRPSKSIAVPDAYVQSLISKAEAEWNARGEGICVGSFVRILGGEIRGMCGVVSGIEGDRAIVVVSLMTKQIINECPLRNLKDLSYIPDYMRVWFFCPEVEQFFKDAEE